MFNHEPTQKPTPDPDFRVNFLKGLRRILLVSWMFGFGCTLSSLWQLGTPIFILLAFFALINLISVYRWNPEEDVKNAAK